MSRTDPQFNLRIPEALRDKVMAAAKENKRSATAEILARLEESFSIPEGFNGSRAAGVKKDLLVRSTEDMENSRPVTRGELWEVLGRAIEQVLDGMTVGQPPDNAKPKPNTGPKPRKRYPKE